MPLAERSRKWLFQTPAVVCGSLPHLQGAQAESSHQFLGVYTLVGLGSWPPLLQQVEGAERDRLLASGRLMQAPDFLAALRVAADRFDATHRVRVAQTLRAEGVVGHDRPGPWLWLGALRRQEAQPPCTAVPGCRSSRVSVSCGTPYGKGPKLGVADTRCGVAA